MPRPVKSGYMDMIDKNVPGQEAAADSLLEGTRFVRACLRKPVMSCYGLLKNRAPIDLAWNSKKAR